MSGDMRIRLRYLSEDKDRHGNARLYVRREGQKKIRIREAPGTEAFMAAYHAALTGKAEAARKVIRGSFRHLCQLYAASVSFKRNDASTRAWQRRALDAICEKHGDKPFALMKPKHVRKIRDERSEEPAAANHRLKAMRAMFNWATEDEEAEENPTLGVRQIRYASDGHHSWEPHEVEQFEDAHPIGSKARLAMAILLYTTCRREDVVRLGPQHMRGNRVKYRQAKNEHRKPVDMDIPLHPDLKAVIRASAPEHLTFLVTEYGRPFTANGFGNKFRGWCNQAGLPHCSAHGLRKATAARLAERGATPHEIMAITGHQSLEEVERYTRAARRRKSADSGMAKLSHSTKR